MQFWWDPMRVLILKKIFKKIQIILKRVAPNGTYYSLEIVSYLWNLSIVNNMQQNGVHNVNQIDKILFYKWSIIEHVRCVLKGGSVNKSLVSLFTNSAYVPIPFLRYSKEPLHLRSQPIFRKAGYFKMVK